jgi:hypothetical protein
MTRKSVVLEPGTRARDPHWAVRGLLLLLILFVPGSLVSGQLTLPADGFSIPAQSDWTDYGLIFTRGPLGEWDYQLWGGFAGSATKKGGSYYLYYQGSSGYQISPTEVATWRAVGVATSPDGINFEKSVGNPVLTWFPNNEPVEGPVSSAAMLDDNDEILLYYGANTAQAAPLVDADGRLARSVDGFNFADQGIVLNHGDSSLWAYGDQLYPIIAMEDAGRWFVYYIPHGVPEGGTLGVAWGNGPAALSNSSAVWSEGSSVQAWGMGGSGKINSETYALFLSDVFSNTIEVRTVSLETPNQLSAPIHTYRFGDVVQATVLLDSEANTWFMYYRTPDAYGVKLAPAGQPDTSPPTAPGNLTATPTSDRQVNLSWSPAIDAETGIVQYKVFRDGLHVATVKGWSYSDTGLVEQTQYSYTVSAINYHGVEGPQSAAATAITLVDVTPPHVVSVNASGAANEVRIVFDESVEKASAERPTNYVIDQGMTVFAAKLSSDVRTVLLTTSQHSHLATYRITVNNLRDRAYVPNVIASNTTMAYTYSSVRWLVGAWTFDEGEGDTAYDTSSYGNHGSLLYAQSPGPSWTAGKSGAALYFDGIDDQVTISGSGSLNNVTGQSHTFAAWALAERLPPALTLNDTSYSVLVRNYTGLYYDHNGRFRAQIRLASGENLAVSSEIYPPGTWHHLAMVVDDTNKSLSLYVDGREVSGSPASYSGPLAHHQEAPYYIGTSEPLSQRYEYRFQGKIDEAFIYSMALSQSDVRALETPADYYWLFLPAISRLQ